MKQEMFLLKWCIFVELIDFQNQIIDSILVNMKIK